MATVEVPKKEKRPRYPTYRYAKVGEEEMKHVGLNRAGRREWGREQRGTSFWMRTVRPTAARQRFDKRQKANR